MLVHGATSSSSRSLLLLCCSVRLFAATVLYVAVVLSGSAFLLEHGNGGAEVAWVSPFTACVGQLGVTLSFRVGVVPIQRMNRRVGQRSYPLSARGAQLDSTVIFSRT